MLHRPSTRSYGLGCHFFRQPDTLVIIRGTLSSQWLVDHILRTVLLPFFLECHGLIFHQDNARPHTARVVMNCLTACKAFPWPSRTSDISPVMHVWDMMGRRMGMLMTWPDNWSKFD
ncbi:transposable element Tc1 transposase [Trichonephila clavipes]|nr:transposable element Tc1 transposase [Trichonephila clavipes]